MKAQYITIGAAAVAIPSFLDLLHHRETSKGTTTYTTPRVCRSEKAKTKRWFFGGTITI